MFLMSILSQIHLTFWTSRFWRCIKLSLSFVINQSKFSNCLKKINFFIYVNWTSKYIVLIRLENFVVKNYFSLKKFIKFLKVIVVFNYHVWLRNIGEMKLMHHPVAFDGLSAIHFPIDKGVPHHSMVSVWKIKWLVPFHSPPLPISSSPYLHVIKLTSPDVKKVVFPVLESVSICKHNSINR